MADFKSLTLEGVLDFEETQIRELFPYGIAKVPARKKKAEDRFAPAKRGKADIRLGELLELKRDRLDKPRLLKPGSGYTSNPAYALGKDRRYAGEFGEPEPEGDFSATQLKVLAEDNWQRFLGDLESIGTRNQRLYVQRRIGKKKAA